MTELTYATGCDIVCDEDRYYWCLVDEADCFLVATSERYFDSHREAAADARRFGFKRTAHRKIETVTSRAMKGPR